VFGLGLVFKNQDWIAKYDSPLISTVPSPRGGIWWA